MYLSLLSAGTVPLYVSHHHLLKSRLCLCIFPLSLSLFVSTVSVSSTSGSVCVSCLCLLTLFSPRLSCLRLLHLFNCVLHVYSLVSHISDSSRARSIYLCSPCVAYSLLQYVPPLDSPISYSSFPVPFSLCRSCLLFLTLTLSLSLISLSLTYFSLCVSLFSVQFVQCTHVSHGSVTPELEYLVTTKWDLTCKIPFVGDKIFQLWPC